MSEPGSRRGRTHDAEGAREAILNAAEEVFAEHGFDGARVDAIAAVAGYNKSLIFQYFGDKLGLYTEVIRRADDQSRVMQVKAVEFLADANALNDPDKFKAVLKDFMGDVFDYFIENPRITRIFLWEMAEGWQTYTRIVPEVGLEDLKQFGPLVYKIGEMGLLRSDMDAIAQIIFAELMITQYMASIPIIQLLVPDLNLESPESRTQAREFLTEFIVNGLLANGLKPKSKGD